MPKYIIWENVKNILSKRHIHNFNNYLEELNSLGYNSYYKVLNAKDYGIPQNRERVFTVSIRKDIDKGSFCFPEKQELNLNLKDFLEANVKTNYYISDDLINNLCVDEKRDTELHIINATKKGYLEAVEGDSINLSYPKSKTKRGRVGKQVAQTLTCNDNMAVAVIDKNDN